MVLGREALGPAGDLRLQVERVLDAAGQVPQRIEEFGFLRVVQLPRSFARVAVRVNSATSWVVKALVEATPISAPARV